MTRRAEARATERRTSRRPARVIDGEAIVLSRLPAAPSPKPAGEEPDFSDLLEEAAAQARAQEASPSRERGGPRSASPASTLLSSSREALKARSRRVESPAFPKTFGAYLATRHRSALRAGALAAGFLLGFLALPVFLVAAPTQPVAATSGAADHVLPEGVALGDFSSAFLDNRGHGMLEVSGRLDVARPDLPALAVEVVTRDGNRYSKPLAITGPNRAGGVEFRSRFAVAAPVSDASRVSIVAGR